MPRRNSEICRLPAATMLTNTASTARRGSTGAGHSRSPIESRSMNDDQSDKPSRLKVFIAELMGSALLLFIGLSSVILMFGDGNPFEALVPSLPLRRSINGFLFGSVGATIALSPIGKVSGAHVNPIVTMGFWLVGKLTGRAAIGYVIAQFVGAFLGCLPLVLWGSMGRSISFGATRPGEG